jgi:hypothetical protein
MTTRLLATDEKVCPDKKLQKEMMQLPHRRFLINRRFGPKPAKRSKTHI